MKILLIIIIVLFIILFFPIRLKFRLIYNEQNYFIKFYKFTIISKEKANKVKQEKESPKEVKQAETKKQKSKGTFKFISKRISPSVLFDIINTSNFKPKLKLEGTIAYSLADAARTATSYGIISAVLPFFYKLLTVIFKIKKMHLPLNPVFEDRFLLNIDITSIIYLSFAQVIYMGFLIIKSALDSKEANLKREIYE